MNKWKLAFFALAFAVIAGVAGIAYWALSDTEEVAKPPVLKTEGNIVTIETTAKEFEAIAKQYLNNTIQKSPVPVEIVVGEQIQLLSTLTVFGVDVPMAMDFDPLVEDGNIVLQQTAMNIGKLDIPPKTVLKVMQDSVEFPSWVTVIPNDEQIYVDISRLNIAAGSRVRAKEIDLTQDKIVFEVIVPTK